MSIIIERLCSLRQFSPLLFKHSPPPINCAIQFHLSVANRTLFAFRHVGHGQSNLAANVVVDVSPRHKKSRKSRCTTPRGENRSGYLKLASTIWRRNSDGGGVGGDRKRGAFVWRRLRAVCSSDERRGRRGAMFASRKSEDVSLRFFAE
jgi:hypothetical protein